MRKNVSLILILAFTLTACGKDSESTSGGSDPLAASPPAASDPSIAECIIADLNDFVDPLCLSVIFDGAPLSVVTISESQVMAKASRRSGGTGGTKWFDSQNTFSFPVDLVLPTQIPAIGNAANGHKLYIKFNDQTDCAWYSSAGTRYQSPRCFDGATRSPGTSLGFTGGMEVGSIRMDAVTRITMTVNGSGGSGVLTTATANFLID